MAASRIVAVVLLHVLAAAVSLPVPPVFVPRGMMMMVPEDYNPADSGCNSTILDNKFTSPRYPKHYPLSTSCMYHLKVADGKKIKLTFAYIETESCCDYIDVFDGQNMDYPKLERLRGTASNRIFTSSGSQMTIRFYSDMTVVYKGFEAQYQVI